MMKKSGLFFLAGLLVGPFASNQAVVFTNDLANTLLAFDILEVGGVIINDVPTWRIDHMPYGGVKDSGIGREGPRYTIEEMTELKLLVINRDVG